MSICNLPLFLFLFSVPLLSLGQSSIGQDSERKIIEWQNPVNIKVSESESILYLSFTGAQFDVSDKFLPRYSLKVTFDRAHASFAASIIDPVYELLNDKEILAIKDVSLVKGDIDVSSRIIKQQKEGYGMVSFIPIRKNNLTNKFEKLVSFSLSYSYQSSLSSIKSGNRSVRTYPSNSVLQSGDWYKIAISSDGIYKLDYSFFKNLGIDVEKLNPRDIRIYGNGGEMLPELNSEIRADDLFENRVFVQGENDNVFDKDDYVLFYGKGVDSWTYNNSTCPNFSHKVNLYSDSSYYFINVDLGLGKRITSQSSSNLPITNTVSSFDDYTFHEKEDVNLIKSGRKWFGEYFENNPTNSFSFSFPNIETNSPVTVKTSIASRNFSGNASYLISSQTGSTTFSIAPTTDDLYSNYVNIGEGCFTFSPNSPTITINVTKQTSNAVAWLDYIEVNARRQLIMHGSQMIFQDKESVGPGNIAQYNLASSSPIQVWDISDISNVKVQDLISAGTGYQFSLAADIQRQFVAFTGTSFKTPIFSGKIPNQNLHAMSNKDFIIVTHADFLSEATQLAKLHENIDGLSSAVVTAEQVYNEFSSGRQDISAIRDFVKMFYDKATTADELPDYLLLFGDGSYDNKDRFSNNTNYIPTYQSENSSIATQSYVSDDFYGLLDDAEGVWLADMVDIGIGRFPVKTKLEAQVAVNKVLEYTKTGYSANQNSSAFGNWRNSICFIGDDEDGALHMQQADQLATLVDTSYNNYNIDKIYLDAYKQEAKPGGNRYPGVVEAINSRIDRGVLIVNYTGHGGEMGLAHERIVDVSQINKWQNKNKLFLFYTASCEVSRYDDPVRTSAGEYAFLNPNGGAIALFSTVRVVYASPNFNLNRDFFRAAFEPINGRMPRLGDLYKYSKTQANGNSVNSRNFALLGDPALTLAYPKFEIVTDSINKMAVSSISMDTLKALSIVHISGHLNDKNGNLLNDFDGILYPTVYDKTQTISTLSNDGLSSSPLFNFKLQKNILYNGKVTVENGKFKFSFIIPKDIAYHFGIGRISYYAENGYEDASGYYENVIIGGSNDSAAADNVGPEANLYLNDTKFVFGGLTDESPDLYALLRDENGINTVGNGIGHDIAALLDGNTEDAIVLNDYYQADLDSYQSGSIRYPFSEISEGKHQLKLKVWDVYNNSSEAYTEFVVAKSAELALTHVLNYPNPFTTKTQFYFEHNHPYTQLQVQIQVFTVAGRLVKNIFKQVNTEGYRSEPIDWDGRDDFGDRIGRGVYVYKIKVKSSEGSVVEKYEKLVILN